jgi:hypothetical protein
MSSVPNIPRFANSEHPAAMGASAVDPDDIVLA